MIATLRAEFKKLFTVRSTYLLMLLALLLTGFLSFYVEGVKNTAGMNIANARTSLFLSGTITQHANTVSIFCALIALLLMAHEYRYNTIVYTLTASNSRSKVLFAKIIAVLIFVLGLSLLLTAASFGFIFAGAAAAGHHLPPQSINYMTYFAKTAFACEAFAMAGLLFATLIRNQVGAIAALFILPNTVEGLLSLLLKNNSIYMPFTALQEVIQAPTLSGVKSVAREAARGSLTPPKGALVFLAYLVPGWIVTWYLFLRRDAT